MAHPVRRLVLACHFWSALLLGAWFVLLGLTGSALVFYLDIDRALNPQIQVARPARPSQSLEAIHQALRQTYPERDGPWRIELPLHADMPVMARYQKPVERAGRYFAPLLVTLAPAQASALAPNTLEVTSSRFWGDTVVTWLFDLHYTLLLGAAGLTLVGIVGLVNLAMLLSGLYLWWPSAARLRSALRVLPRSGAVRRAYDLHCAGGVYWLLVLAVLCGTGAALAFPEQAKALVHANPPPAAPAPTRLRDTPRTISLDVAVAHAKARFGDAEVRWVETSGVGGTPIALRMRQQSEPSRRFPQTRVWLDPASGEILAVSDPLAANAGARALYWMHPLHNGEAFGLGGRIAVFISGLIPLLLFVTGLMRWRHKVRARASGRESPLAVTLPAANAGTGSRHGCSVNR